MVIKRKIITLYLFGLIFILCSCTSKTGNLYRIQVKGLYGFIDSVGNIVIEPQYKYVGEFNKEGYATVITECKFKVRSGIFQYLFFKYGVIDKSNTLVMDTIHTIEFSKISNIRRLSRKREETVDNFAKKMLFLEDVYDELIKFQSGLIVVQDTNTLLMGYMNLKGDTVISTKYKTCYPFYNGKAIVDLYGRQYNSEGIIDSLGNEIVTDGYTFNGDFNYNETWGERYVTNSQLTGNLIKLSNESYWLLFDSKGKICSDTIRGDGFGVHRIYNSSADWYVWLYGNIFLNTPIFSFVNKEGEFISDLNKNGKLDIFDETFEDVTSMRDGIAGIKIRKDGESRWLFIDEQLNIKSTPFDSVLSFNEGMVAVKECSQIEGVTKWGFVDRNFKNIIPYKFDMVESFHNGLAYFKVGNIEGYINKKGEVVWSTTIY